MAVSFSRYLGFSAIRNSDKRLVPAIKAFNTGLCFLFFGSLLTIVGLITIAYLSIVGLMIFVIGISLLIYAMININRIETIIRNELNTNPAIFPNINYNAGFNINPQQTHIHYIVPPQTNSYQPQLNAYQSQPNLYQLTPIQLNEHHPQTNLYQPQPYPNQQPYNIQSESDAPPPYRAEPEAHQSNVATDQTNQHNLSSQKF